MSPAPVALPARFLKKSAAVFRGPAILKAAYGTAEEVAEKVGWGRLSG